MKMSARLASPYRLEYDRCRSVWLICDRFGILETFLSRAEAQVALAWMRK